MRIIRNERRIQRGEFIGKYATLAGLMVLLAGLIVSFAKPDWVLPLLVCMVVGVVLSVVGGYFAGRYVGPLAHHEALATVLKGLDDRHALFQYVLPASHVLLEPGGCTVFVVKAHGGEVIYEKEGRWKHRQQGKVFRQFAGQESVGAPDLEARQQAQKLAGWLSSQLPGVEVPVRAAIVFASPDVTVDAAASEVPVFFGKKVKAWLRGPGKLKPLPGPVQRQLSEVLEGNA